MGLFSHQATEAVTGTCETPNATRTITSALNLADKGEEIEWLVKASNLILSRNYIVSHQDIGMYPVSYLGHLLKFFATNLLQYQLHNIPPATLFTQWMEQRLPVPYNPQIEITVEQLFMLLVDAIERDPIKAIDGDMKLAIEQIHARQVALHTKEPALIGNTALLDG